MCNHKNRINMLSDNYRNVRCFCVCEKCSVRPEQGSDVCYKAIIPQSET
jgi:hypothetical protein